MMISHHRLFRTIFRLLFNFQGSSLLSFRKPLYYITSFSICQEVFEIFFRIFSFSRHRRFIIHVLSLATFIFYHISSRLSIPFSKFFEFFRSFFDSVRANTRLTHINSKFARSTLIQITVANTSKTASD